MIVQEMMKRLGNFLDTFGPEILQMEMKIAGGKDLQGIVYKDYGDKAILIIPKTTLKGEEK